MANDKEEVKQKKLSPEETAKIITFFVNFLSLLCGILIFASVVMRIVTNYVFSSGSWYARMVPSSFPSPSDWGNFLSQITNIVHFWVVCVFLLTISISIIVFTIYFGGFIKKLLGFYTIWFGRGLYFILAGCLLLSMNYWDLVIAPIVIIVGLVFLVLQCVPMVSANSFITCGSDK